MTGKVIDFEMKKLEKTMEKESEEFDDNSIIIDDAMNIADVVIQELYDLGYDVKQYPKTMNDMFLLIDSIVSLVHRSKGKDYPLQDVTDAIFETDSPLDFLSDIDHDNDD